jgi:hypothetical protein
MKKNDRKVVEAYDYVQSMFDIVLSVCPPIIKKFFYKFLQKFK